MKWHWVKPLIYIWGHLSPWETHPPPGHAEAGARDGGLGGTHPPPLGKVTSGSSPSKLLLPEGSAQGVGWGLLGGACSSQNVISWWRSSTSRCSSWSARLPSFVWGHCRVPPPWWVLPVGELGSSSPSKGHHSLEGSTPLTVMYALIWGSKGAMVLMAMDPLHNSIAFMAPHDAHCISSIMQNIATNSLAKNQSTPKGWVCPNVMHIFMMSSSVTEVTSNGVPSACIMINTLIFAPRGGSLVGTGSLPEAVAEDKVNILVLN